jgi:hypothetical protein
LREDLRLDSRVRFVSPIYEDSYGSEALFLNRLVVRFKRGVGNDQIEALASREGMEILRWVVDGPRPIVWLTFPPAQDHLAVAARIHEHSMTEWADPDKFSGYRTNQEVGNLYGWQWYMHNGIQLNGVNVDLDVENAWTLTTGNSTIRVAVLGTGIEGSHARFQWTKNLGGDPCESGWDDYYPTQGIAGDAWNPAPRYNDYHETAVAGIIAAAHDPDGTRGVAPGVKLLSARTNSQGDSIPDSFLALAVRWAWEECDADVVNGSWGGPLPSTQLGDAIEDGTERGRDRKGTVFVFAAGNDTKRESASFKIIHFPASLPYTISVGAMDRHGDAANYTPRGAPGCWPGGCPVPPPPGSPYGPPVDVVALSGYFEGECGDPPGTQFVRGPDIYTTDAFGVVARCDPFYDGYMRNFSGTSASTPQVAGAVALLVSLEPNLTFAQVANRVRDSADYWGDVRDFGAGKVNIARMLGYYTGSPPPITSVTIDGPDFVKPNAICSWFASASGGTPPYTFMWYKNGVYQTTGSELTLNTESSGFTLRLDVTDSQQQTGSTTMVVTVNSGAMECFA